MPTIITARAANEPIQRLPTQVMPTFLLLTTLALLRDLVALLRLTFGFVAMITPFFLFFQLFFIFVCYLMPI
jgi:hypothetical protein